jgi:alpha-glucosidase
MVALLPCRFNYHHSQTAGERTIRTSKTIVTALAIALSALPGSIEIAAQTLARPGWVGSGLTQQTWFKHAVFYEIDTRSFQDSNGDGVGDLKGITERLEYIRSLGVDAILLAPLTPAQGNSAPNTIDPVLGNLDEFDDLILQASRMKIRVLLDLPNPDPALARFWLTRGVAGFHIPAANPAGQSNASAIQSIRKLLPGYVGQRILISDADTSANPANQANPARPGANELVLDNALLKVSGHPNPVAGAEAGSGAEAQSTVAGKIRAALEEAQTLGRQGGLLLATDAPGVPHSLERFSSGNPTPAQAADLSRIAATILMLNRVDVLLSAGQEVAVTASGTGAAMLWGAPPPAPSSTEPAAISEPAPAKPAPAPATDRYVPYVAPKPVSKAIAAPPPDPASVAGQELDPKSPLSLYRQLNQLRHGGTALRDGDENFLDFDALNALVWVRKPASPSFANPPIVVLCNLSDKPVAINLKPELTRLHLRGSFLKTILRSDGGMGAMDLSPVRIPPYGVYVGELKF